MSKELETQIEILIKENELLKAKISSLTDENEYLYIMLEEYEEAAIEAAKLEETIKKMLKQKYEDAFWKSLKFVGEA